MPLLSLPLELLHEILAWSIQIRGIKRGLRLRLVNKAFAREVLATLPLFRLLDSHFRRLPPNEDAPACPMATAYLERRVLNERQGGSSVLLRIRSVAAQLCQESVDEPNEQNYIRKLCPLVIQTCRVRLDKIWSTEQDLSQGEGIVYGNDLASDVYVAALYTKTWPVIARWVGSGNELGKDSLVFGHARRHAARFGSPELLAAMMDTRYEDTFQRLRSYFLGRTAEFGRIDTTRFVFNFQATQRPWAFARKRSRPSYPYYNEQNLAGLNTPSKEIFEFITEKRRIHCTTRTFGVKENTAFLHHCAEKGWADMAAQYLALGARADGLGTCLHDETQRPILVACRNGHEDVVRMLLAYSASTSQPALETAVKYGHLTIVTLLLDHGAELGRAVAAAIAGGYRMIIDTLLEQRKDARVGLQGLLVYAIELEDEALFQLLVQHAGGFVEKSTRADCLKAISDMGLESMLRVI